MTQTNSCSGFICLHVGAGYHSINNEILYTNLCKNACKLGKRLLKRNYVCTDIVEKVCSFLEDSDLTNAGYGSNICQDGSIECEAGIMESKTKRFAAVVCVKNLMNPVQLAKMLLNNQSEEHELGLCPPMILAGKGTKLKAIELGLKLVENKSLISKKAWEDFLSFQKRVQSVAHSHKKSDEVISRGKSQIGENSKDTLQVLFSSKKQKLSLEFKDAKEADEHLKEKQMSERLDTIGVICIDTNGEMASAISSGGIAFKKPGRLGHVAQYGAGCWAFQHSPSLLVGSCTSGCGELLAQTNLAKKVADYSINNEILNYNDFLLDEFVNSQYISSSQLRLCGLIVAKYVNEGSDCYVDFHLAHTTESFGVAFMAGNMKSPKVIMSRLDHLNTRGPVSQGFFVKL